MKRPLALLSVAVLLGGCPKKEAADCAGVNDPDGKRSTATRIALGTPVTDDLDWDKCDQADWKQVQVDKPGVLTVELRWDNPAAALDVEVYDAYGTQLAGSPDLVAGAPQKVVHAPVEQAGPYFVKVSARPHAASVYSVVAKLETGAPSPPPPPPPPSTPQPTTEATPDAGVDAAPAEQTEPPAEPTGNEVQGRVVSSYREGDSLVLHLDKGSAAGVKVGTRGAVLAGSSGDDKLEGGDFTVTQVVDENRSIARVHLRSLGKNNRVVFYVQ